MPRHNRKSRDTSCRSSIAAMLGPAHVEELTITMLTINAQHAGLASSFMHTNGDSCCNAMVVQVLTLFLQYVLPD